MAVSDVCRSVRTYLILNYMLLSLSVQFYGIMMGLYIIYAVVWTILMAVSYKDVIKLHVSISV